MRAEKRGEVLPFFGRGDGAGGGVYLSLLLAFFSQTVDKTGEILYNGMVTIYPGKKEQL
jgi:hypothetical protein